MMFYNEVLILDKKLLHYVNCWIKIMKAFVMYVLLITFINTRNDKKYMYARQPRKEAEYENLKSRLYHDRAGSLVVSNSRKK